MKHSNQPAMTGPQKMKLKITKKKEENKEILKKNRKMSTPQYESEL